MKIKTVHFTELDLAAKSVGVGDVYDTFNSTTGNPVDDTHSIVKLEFNDGDGDYIDGFRVTYNYIDPKTGSKTQGHVTHGTFKESEVRHKALKLEEDEYICGARIYYANKGTEDEHIGRITFYARQGTSGPVYQADDWGETPQSGDDPYFWPKENTKNGKLYVFGARENNQAATKGLKALCFGTRQQTVAVAQSLTFPAVDATGQTSGKKFDDLAKLGSILNYDCPIKAIDVWFDRVIEGIQVTYNLNNGKQAIEMHGNKTANAPAKIHLKNLWPSTEVTGIHGKFDLNSGDLLSLLDFKIYDSKTRVFRNSGTCGKFQDTFVQSSRKDICTRGPLVALAGWDDKSKKPGLYNVKFFTRVPPWDSPN
ncbi:Jacalin-like lectin domain protein [Ceratobasidium sp. AG-Ba]|nr:Jacalin-like lectin domain protein [Ceratobasidium sp. AG-Ba]